MSFAVVPPQAKLFLPDLIFNLFFYIFSDDFALMSSQLHNSIKIPPNLGLRSFTSTCYLPVIDSDDASGVI